MNYKVYNIKISRDRRSSNIYQKMIIINNRNVQLINAIRNLLQKKILKSLWIKLPNRIPTTAYSCRVPPAKIRVSACLSE